MDEKVWFVKQREINDLLEQVDKLNFLLSEKEEKIKELGNKIKELENKD